MTTTTLPVEIFLRVLHFLTPCEITRLRQVCKQFRDITRDDALWRDAYTEARFLRPPGPFLWQSTQYLESTLVKSELISKAWTSQPPERLWHRSIPCGSRGINLISIWTVLFGRWCLILEGRTIQCHDLETGTCQTLYDGVGHPDFWFTAAFTTDNDKQRIFLLLDDFMLPHQFIRLLEFTVHDQGFSDPRIMDLSHIAPDLPPIVWQLTRKHARCYGETPFLSLQSEDPRLVLDLRSRSLFLLPIFSVDPDELGSPPPPDPEPPVMSTQLVLTKTHVIAIRTCYYGRLSILRVVIQAFTVPKSTSPRDTHGIAELRLSHQAAFQTVPRELTLLRNSKVDPITRSTSIGLLCFSDNLGTEGLSKQISYVDLTLPDASSTSNIQPIHVHANFLFESTWDFHRYTASDDGHVRGFLVSIPWDAHAPGQPDTITIRKFAIDASGEECDIVVGDPSSMSSVVDSRSATDDMIFEGFTGRIHYSDGGGPGTFPRIVTVEIN